MQVAMMILFRLASFTSSAGILIFWRDSERFSVYLSRVQLTNCSFAKLF